MGQILFENDSEFFVKCLKDKNDDLPVFIPNGYLKRYRQMMLKLKVFYTLYRLICYEL